MILTTEGLARGLWLVRKQRKDWELARVQTLLCMRATAELQLLWWRLLVTGGRTGGIAAAWETAAMLKCWLRGCFCGWQRCDSSQGQARPATALQASAAFKINRLLQKASLGGGVG